MNGEDLAPGHEPPGRARPPAEGWPVPPAWPAASARATGPAESAGSGGPANAMADAVSAVSGISAGAPAGPESAAAGHAPVTVAPVAWPGRPSAESTGEQRVDVLVTRLGELAGRPVAEHVGVYADLHHGLQEVLTATGQEPVPETAVQEAHGPGVPGPGVPGHGIPGHGIPGHGVMGHGGVERRTPGPAGPVPTPPYRPGAR